MTDYQSEIVAAFERISSYYWGNPERRSESQIAGFIQHFSHPDLLQQMEGNNQINCEICQAAITGKAYGCSGCNFFLHDTCLATPQKIRHKSHPHDLILINKPYPSDKITICNACRGVCPSLVYHCSLCHYDLHASCAGLPLSVLYAQQHPLYLNFNTSTSPLYCSVCRNALPKKGMLYKNKDSGCNVHLACAVQGQKYSVDEVQKRLRRCRVN